MPWMPGPLPRSGRLPPPRPRRGGATHGTSTLIRSSSISGHRPSWPRSVGAAGAVFTHQPTHLLAVDDEPLVPQGCVDAALPVRLRTRRRRPGCGRRSPRHLRRRSARPRCPRRAGILAAVRAGRAKTANEAIARTRRSTGTPVPVNAAREGELGTAPSMASMSPDGPPAGPALPARRRGTPRNDRRRGAGPAGTRSTAARSVRIDNGNRLKAHRRIISAATVPRSPLEEGPGYPSGHRGAGALRERYRPRDPRA